MTDLKITIKLVVDISSSLAFLLDPPPPLIEFTKPVYNASESGDAVVGVLVTDGEVVEPVTVRSVTKFTRCLVSRGLCDITSYSYPEKGNETALVNKNQTP